MKKIALLISGLLLSGLVGCTSTVLLKKNEITEFVGVPENSSIDNATSNKKGQLRFEGHFSYNIDEAKKESTKKIKIDTSANLNSTILLKKTYYTSILSQARGSFGGELTYSFSNFIGFGGQINYATIKSSTLSDSTLPEKFNTFEAGVHIRLTKSRKFLTVGYRPELYLGIIKGMKWKYDSSMVLIDKNQFHKLLISFNQSMFMRISPVEFMGMFIGLQHNVSPYAIIDRMSEYRSSFSFYGGVSAELLEMLSINIYTSVPIATINSTRELPISLGVSLGIMFNTKKD